MEHPPPNLKLLLGASLRKKKKPEKNQSATENRALKERVFSPMAEMATSHNGVLALSSQPYL